MTSLMQAFARFEGVTHNHSYVFGRIIHKTRLIVFHKAGQRMLQPFPKP